MQNLKYMTALSNLTDEEIVEAVGNRWPAMTKALMHFRDPRNCRHKYDAARRTLEKFIIKHGSMTR